MTSFTPELIKQCAEAAVENILTDLQDLHGLRAAWQQTTGSTKRDIRGRWELMVQAAIEGALRNAASKAPANLSAGQQTSR